MNHTEEAQHITPGMLAILAMSLIELAASLIVFVIWDILPVAIVFAVIALLLTFFATQVRRRPWQDPPRKSDPPPPTLPAPIARVLPILTSGLALASLIGAIYQLVSGQPLAAVLFACWVISFGIQSVRLWPHK